MVEKKLRRRQSNFELLRILAMLMIIAHHFSLEGGFSFSPGELSLSRIWLSLLGMPGKIGVNVYVLISGYFLILEEEKLFNLKRILKLWLQIVFYSIVITLIHAVLTNRHLGFQEIRYMLLPIGFSKWWFASAYFMLYLIHPFLNRFLNGLSKSLFQKYLILILGCWCILPTLTNSLYQSNDLIWLVAVYSLAAYIRLYGLGPRLSGRQYAGLFVLFALLTLLFSAFMDLLSGRWSVFHAYSWYFFAQEKLPTLLMSVCLFMAFAHLEIPYRKGVNLLASATFGVYLIHDFDVVSMLLWLDIFKNARWQNSPWLIPYSLMAIVAVFLGCAALDLLRKTLLEQPLLRFIDARADRWLQALARLTARVRTLIFGPDGSGTQRSDH